MESETSYQAHYSRECYYHWPDYCLRLEDATVHRSVHYDMMVGSLLP